MDKTKSMCRGCYDDFYNHNRPSGCWMFDNAEIVERVEVGVWEPPPYSPKRARSVLSCFHRKGVAFLPLDDVRVKDPTALDTTNES